MRIRKTFAVAFLLLAAAMAPGLAWAGAQFHSHQHGHGHAHEHGSARELANILVHGHEHQEGTPDHEHSVLPSPAVRQDAPGSAQASEAALLKSPACEISETASGWQPPRLAGPSPPILHLHCTLLI